MKKIDHVSFEETTKNDINGMIDIVNQERILMTVIAQKQYNRLIPMIENGYKLSINVLEALKWCGDKNFTRKLFNHGFEFVGDYKHLLAFLNAFYGETEAAAYIMNAAQKNASGNSCWCRIVRLLSKQQLAANGYWEELLRRGEWEMLAQHGQFDLIINSVTHCQNSGAVKVLSHYGQTNRIIELQKFEWLTKMAGGEKILCQHKQFKLLFHFRKQLANWTEWEALKELCQFPEGRELLFHEKQYQVLIQLGYAEMLQQNGLWKELARHGCYDIIDWNLWYQEERQKAEKKGMLYSMDDFYNHAADAKKWLLLADDCQRGLLFKHRQFGLWLQSFSSPKKEKGAEKQNRFASWIEKLRCQFFPSAEDEELD